MKNKLISALLLFALLFSLGSCSSGSLSGKYTNSTNEYTVEFKSDGLCTWYQDGHFFNGTYEKTENGWQLNVQGNGLYVNTIFNAVKKGADLVISGGNVENETFTKK